MGSRLTPILLVLGCATTCALAQAPTKKLIEYGWDVPAPSFIAEHIREMEQRPFDGLILRVPNIGQVFEAKNWQREDAAAELAALEQIQWGRFTDNFIIMYAASTMDWWSDADWECVLHNVGLCAEAARLGHCKGVCFDAEPYGNNPWHYPSQARASERSFAEYEAIARKRGAQCMDRIQQEMEAPVVHTFFLLSYFADIARETDPAIREQRLSQEGYGLLPAFLNGMLGAAKPGTVLTDGNESSYYYTEPLPYYRSFCDIRQTGLGLIAPENRAKYLSQVQCAQALYVDYLFDYWQNPTPAKRLTPEERARWFEHNTYWSLTTADEYVWLYSERMNWWTNENLPAGLEDAVVSARGKVARREPLGFDMAEVLRQAEERAKADARARLQTRTAHVQHLGPGEAPPTVNGALGDECWTTGQLEPFVAYLDQPEPGATTKAWLRYDAAGLYVAVQCDEPKMDALQVAGAARDGQVWQGDSVDLFVSAGPEPTPYYHFIVNPDGVRWDASCGVRDDLSWNPEYQVATARGESSWTVEWAIPWASLGMAAPAPGSSLRGNTCRCRTPASEYTEWSQTVSGFIEPDSFGRWVF
jgi:hypothetical protein